MVLSIYQENAYAPKLATRLFTWLDEVLTLANSKQDDDTSRVSIEVLFYVLGLIEEMRMCVHVDGTKTTRPHDLCQ